MSDKMVKLKVFRSKDGQKEPTYDTFSVPAGPRTTVLDALLQIRRETDETLVVRHSCLHACCGTCGMKVNGTEVLGCVTNIWELNSDTIVVEPLDNSPLVSDLAVDMGVFYEHFGEYQLPLIRENALIPQARVPEGIEKHLRMESCLECGLCVSACPTLGTDHRYLGPASLAAAWRLLNEPRGVDEEAVLDWVNHEHGCWRCHMVMECSEVCPSNVDPAGAIMALRRRILFGKR